MNFFIPFHHYYNRGRCCTITTVGTTPLYHHYSNNAIVTSDPLLSPPPLSQSQSQTPLFIRITSSVAYNLYYYLSDYLAGTKTYNIIRHLTFSILSYSHYQTSSTLHNYLDYGIWTKYIWFRKLCYARHTVVIQAIKWNISLNTYICWVPKK